MEPRDQTHAPFIAGINAQGEPSSIDYSANLVNVVLFFDPVSRHSLEAVEAMQLLSLQYEKLSVSFWFVMEPRLSCEYKTEIAQRTLTRLGLFSNVLFDANSMLALGAGIDSLPSVFVADSSSAIRSQFEGDIAFREIERAIQARLALSGYRVDLPGLGEIEMDFAHSHSTSVVRQLGYGSGDGLYAAMVIPESNHEFSLPDLYLSNTVYPHGDWYVGRDYMEGKNGSTVYLSCSKEESIYLFAGAEEDSALRLHTSIEAPGHFVIGRDVRNDNGLLSVRITDYRPYEVVSCAGDSDVMVSLQVMDGSLKLYTVEFCPLNQLIAINR